MNDLSRRELMTSILQALLLALFPWLRQSPRGLEVAREGAERIVASGTSFRLSVVPSVKLTAEQARLLGPYDSWADLMTAAAQLPGSKIVDSVGHAVITPGYYDLSSVTLTRQGETMPLASITQPDPRSSRAAPFRR